MPSLPGTAPNANDARLSAWREQQRQAVLQAALATSEGRDKVFGIHPVAIAQRVIEGTAKGFVTLPQRALQGAAQYRPGSGDKANADAAVGPATETALTVMGGSGVVPRGAGELRMGIKAYHGSPHDFDAFSMDKIGTGEGAQAYGHGLYFAENPAVAAEYKTRLGGTRTGTFSKQTASDAQDLINRAGSRDLAIKQAEDNLSFEQDPSLRAQWQDVALYLRGDKAPRSRTYEVSINAHPDEFLDWDKPLSEQPQKVQKALYEAGLAPPTTASREFLEQRAKPGNWYADQLQYLNDAASKPGAEFVPTSPKAMDALRAAGIKGIRYADQGSRYTPARMRQLESDIHNYKRLIAGWRETVPESRSAREGLRVNISQSEQALAEAEAELAKHKANPGTSNYVVFSADVIDILKKYGIAGLTAGGAGAAMMSGKGGQAQAAGK